MASGSEGSTASADQEETTEKQDARNAEAEGGEQQDDQQDDSASEGSSTSAIEDVSSLPGETVNDQDGRKIGEVKEIYGVGDGETPMWVTIESSTGLGRSRHVFVPLARIKKQNDDIRVPYSYNHIHESPEVEPGDDLSEEDDRALRAYYAIGLADQELVENAQSYASQVPDEDGPARKMDASDAEGPVREIDETPAAERAAEAYEKQKEEEGEDHRKPSGETADDIFEEDGAGDDEGEKGSDGERSEDDDSKADRSEEQPKAEEKSGGD